MPVRSAVAATVRLYDRLFAVQKPADVELREALNPDSLEVIERAMLEPATLAGMTGAAASGLMSAAAMITHRTACGTEWSP